ncbi:MAG: transcriptional repressor [Dehalococcoidia bacterium]|nr:transcriptional repressor [Dehalococcoidia bacterium]
MMVRKRSNPLADQLLETLEDRGYRDTMPRRTVVQAIASTERHFTAEELREQLPGVGRATVFRALKLLVESGMVCRVLLEDGNLHYQVSHRGHHHHLLCVQCGASQDLVGCDIESPLQQVAALHNFQVSGHWLEVYGRCQSCQSPQPA